MKRIVESFEGFMNKSNNLNIGDKLTQKIIPYYTEVGVDLPVDGRYECVRDGFSFALELMGDVEIEDCYIGNLIEIDDTMVYKINRDGRRVGRGCNIIKIDKIEVSYSKFFEYFIPFEIEGEDEVDGY